jgi:hypothetical protein
MLIPVQYSYLHLVIILQHMCVLDIIRCLNKCILQVLIYVLQVFESINATLLAGYILLCKATFSSDNTL